MSPTVWIKPGILILFGASLDATDHAHHSIQLAWPTGTSRCLVDNQEIEGPLIINSQVKHQLQMQAGWILLVEPQSKLGKSLSRRLDSKAIVSFECDASGELPCADQSPIRHLLPVMLALNLSFEFDDAHTDLSDRRIEQLAIRLEQATKEHRLSPAQWKACDISLELGLSEGRFLHLFREQMGIAWRPYLLWKRTISAINAIIAGASATEAAHLAGFSDSAHLSRSFRNLFGMTISQSQTLFHRS